MIESPHFPNLVETLVPSIRESVREIQQVLTDGGVVTSSGNVVFHLNSGDKPPRIVIAQEGVLRIFSPTLILAEGNLATTLGYENDEDGTVTMAILPEEESTMEAPKDDYSLLINFLYKGLDKAYEASHMSPGFAPNSETLMNALLVDLADRYGHGQLTPSAE